jgi:Putative Flp pilus-assembly TadE/G-like
MSTKRRPLSPRSREHGAVAITLALSMVMLLGLAALVVDIGYAYEHRRHMQTAADAGALAGAAEIYRDRTGTIVSSASSATALNGFADGTGKIVVTVYHPPANGPHADDSRFVEVLVEDNVATFFAGILNFDFLKVTARAVAGIGGSSGDCVYALDPAMENALQTQSSAELTAGCGFVVNSRHARALRAESSSKITGTSVSVTGGASLVANAKVSPTAQTGAPPRPDPLASLPAPYVGGCTYTGQVVISKDTTLNPGVYCGGILARTSAVVTLNPGMYILKGGGLKLESSSEIQGDGVTIYNTFGDGYAYGEIVFESSADVRLRAPTTGPYAGILFFSDRNAPLSTKVHKFQSSTDSYLEGAIYFPNQHIGLQSSSNINARYMVVIARSVYLHSSSELQLNADYSSLPGGSPLKRVALME